MTPKEKAEELYKRMYTQHSNIYPSTAKNCALIAVDEVLHYSKAHGFVGLTEFYEEVKQEIEKL